MFYWGFTLSRSVSQRSLRLLTSAVRKVRWDITEGCLEMTLAKAVMEDFSEVVTSTRRQQREVAGPVVYGMKKAWGRGPRKEGRGRGQKVTALSLQWEVWRSLFWFRSWTMKGKRGRAAAGENLCAWPEEEGTVLSYPSSHRPPSQVLSQA